jgi:hypothetical protein
MTCDHGPARASLNVFTAATKVIGLQPDGDGGWLLLGNCHECRTTLAIAICDCRGRAIKGDIETAPGRCLECLSPRIPTEDEYRNERRIT